MPTEGSVRPNKASISSEVLQRRSRQILDQQLGAGVADSLGQRVDRIYAVFEMNDTRESSGELISQARPNGRCTDQTVNRRFGIRLRKRR